MELCRFLPLSLFDISFSFFSLSNFCFFLLSHLLHKKLLGTTKNKKKKKDTSNLSEFFCPSLLRLFYFSFIKNNNTCRSSPPQTNLLPPRSLLQSFDSLKGATLGVSVIFHFRKDCGGRRIHGMRFSYMI